MENQNPETKQTETPKEKWSLKKWWNSLWKKEESTEKTEEPAEKTAEEPKSEKKSNSWIWWLIGIIIGIFILIFVFANPFSSKEGKEKAKTEKTQPGGTQPTQPGGTQPGGGNTQPGGGNTQPGGGNTQPGGGNTQPNQPGSQITFSYDQSFDFSKMDQSTKDNLKQWETTGTINVDTDEIILKTEVKNYNGKTMVWLQIEGAKGKVKNIFTEPSNIKISL